MQTRRRLPLIIGIVIGIILAIVEPRGIARLAGELRERLQQGIGDSTYHQ